MATTSPTLYTFVETSVFTKRAGELASLGVLEMIQQDLIADPERGDRVRGLHGARKARVADPTMRRGKSGGFRYLYLFLPHVDVIFLLFIFGKKEQADLTAGQTKLLAAIVEAIKKEFT